jgi:hypothetical protein
MMSTLMLEMAAFAREDGLPVDKKLREKLPNLRFTFDKFAGDRGDDLLTQLFGGDDDMSPRLRSAAKKLKSDQDVGSAAAIIEQLCDMADRNRLSGDSLKGIAQLAGESGEVGEAEPLLDPRRLTLTNLPGHALRRGFQQALRRGPSLSDEERDTLELFVVATSNIEQLLSLYFTRYQDGTLADKRNYLYLAWMLWAFLRIRSARLGPRQGSIYFHLPRLGANVITFNYTNFFERSMLPRVKFFHGRLDHFLRLDTRELEEDATQLNAAVDVERVVPFIHELRLDVKLDPAAIDVPAIVPPTSFKPVLSREQLRVWVEADELLQSADLVIVVGYSFGLADEHFNDLLRKMPIRTRIVVVNPDLDHSARSICRVLGLGLDTLRRSTRGPFELLDSQRLTCVKAGAADVTPEFVSDVTR